MRSGRQAIKTRSDCVLRPLPKSEQVSLVPTFLCKKKSITASLFLLLPTKSLILRDTLCYLSSNTGFEPFFILKIREQQSSFFLSINFAYGCIRLQAFRLLHHHFSITRFRQFCQFCLLRAILQEYFLIIADIFCPNTILLFFGYCILKFDTFKSYGTEKIRAVSSI